jgi:hypothetical protein
VKREQQTPSPCALLQVDVNKKKFFAFSSFKNGASNCKATWPGWHRDSTNPDKAAWGCYTGAKSGTTLLEEHREMLTQAEYAEHLQGETENLLQEGEANPKLGFKAYDEHSARHDVPFQPEHDLVARINAKATTWKAKVYPEWEKMTVGEFNRMAGFRPARSAPIRTLPKGDVLLQIAEETKDLPASFDWRCVPSPAPLLAAPSSPLTMTGAVTVTFKTVTVTVRLDHEDGAPCPGPVKSL